MGVTARRRACCSRPTAILPYDEQLIWSTARFLGWPWSLDKHQPFSSSFTYLGFLWNISSRTVELPFDKKIKYLARLDPWLNFPSATLSEAQKLIGTLTHCSLVVPHGSSHLPLLFKFVSGFRNASSSFVRHKISQQLHEELRWWTGQLQLPFVGKSIKVPPPASSVPVYVDASTSWGIGILIDNQWEAFRFLPNTFSQGRNIGWAEMVAVELCISALAALFSPNSHFVIHSDNQGVLAAVRNQCSRGFHANQSLQRMSHTLLSHDLSISGQYIQSSQNPADPISRGLLPPSHSRLSINIQIPDPLASFLVKFIT